MSSPPSEADGTHESVIERSPPEATRFEGALGATTSGATSAMTASDGSPRADRAVTDIVTVMPGSRPVNS